jgi:hypothetical protein
MTFLALVLAIFLALVGFLFTYRWYAWAGAIGLAGAAWAGGLVAGLS